MIDMPPVSPSVFTPAAIVAPACPAVHFSHWLNMRQATDLLNLAKDRPEVDTAKKMAFSTPRAEAARMGAASWKDLEASHPAAYAAGTAAGPDALLVCAVAADGAQRWFWQALDVRKWVAR